jgi:hypothetical protein
MPKDRNQKRGKRKVKRRLFIVCEGKKTEPNYLNGFLKDCNFRGRPVEVRVVKVEKNTAKELVEKADALREIPGDEVWAVFDKNGYTKHHEAFKRAKDKRVNIAFSSISFEYWILIHFEYSTRPFDSADKIIRYLKSKGYMNYEKNDETIYDAIKDRTITAVTHAKKVRKYQHEANPGCKTYELNPYTNIDDLIEAIHKIGQAFGCERF